jgi:hypothetical protein
MLDQVRLQRCVFLSDKAWLAIFSDAADGAVGAVAYLVNPETTTSRLLFSKAKINAVVSNTIPALELAGTVKATAVARNLWRAYGVPVERTYFFADAELCVNWIRNPKREVTREVARKVQKIRIKTLPEHWRHCPGVQNPADTISRGESLSRLLKNDTWWTGPSWLTEGEENWPITKGKAFGHTPVFMENVVRRVVGTYMARKSTPEPVWEPSVAWNWEKSCRRADIMYKFVQWFQSKLTGRPLEKEPGTTGPRPPQYPELMRGWNILLMQSQKKWYPVEYECLRLDEPVPARSDWRRFDVTMRAGVIFASGRSGGDEVPIMSGKCPFAMQYVRHVHETVLQHGGGHATLVVQARRNVYITRLYSLSRQVVRSCTHCKRRNPTLITQKMAPVPKMRLPAATDREGPFAKIAIDNFGPIKIAAPGRGHRREDRYGMVLVCLQSQCIHVEMLPDQSTSSTLLALHRFACRRGRPEFILSDNATGFVAAAKILRESGKTSRDWHTGPMWQDVEWEFTTPRSPNKNGAAEGAVKLVKKALSALSKVYVLKEEQLRHAFLAAEDICNRRPLYCMSADLKDPQVVTPLDLLQWRSGPVDHWFHEDVAQPQLAKHYKNMLEVRQEVWKQYAEFRKQEMQARPKWHAQSQNLKVGDWVVLMDVTLVQEHGLWPIGIITAIKEPAADGIVRSATVKIASAGQVGDLSVPRPLGEYKRNVRDMCKLPYYSEPTLNPPLGGLGEEMPKEDENLNFPDEGTGEEPDAAKAPPERDKPSLEGVAHA